MTTPPYPQSGPPSMPPQHPNMPQQPMPGGPMPGSYAGGPPQYGPRPPMPQSPYQAQASPRKKGPGLKILLIVLILAVLAGAGVFGYSRWSEGQRQEASRAAMVGLLDALSAGSASEALSYLEHTESTTDQPLLTDEVLAANQGTFSYNSELSLIESTKTNYEYRASISINGVDKVVEWSVVDSDGQWRISNDDVMHEVLFDTDRPHIVNGAAIADGQASARALPGSYTVESGMPMLIYAPGTAGFDIFTGGSTTFEQELIMVEGIQDKVIDQARGILNGCAAEKSEPTACDWPLRFENGEVKDGTVAWELIPPDPAADLTIPAGPWLKSSGYSVNVSVSYQTDATGEGTLTDGSEGYFDEYLENRSSVFKLDLSGAEPVLTLL